MAEVVESVPLVAKKPVPDSVIAPAALTVILPEVLLMAACTNTELVPPVDVRPIVPPPPAVTAAPTVRTPPVACKLMSPPEPVVIGLVLVVKLPLLVTLTLAPGVWVIPVTVSVAMVLVKLITLLVELLAVKVATALVPAPLRV